MYTRTKQSNPYINHDTLMTANDTNDLKTALIWGIDNINLFINIV